MLSVTHLTRRFGARTVFQNLSLVIQRGEYVAITGESGVGKSTLRNLLVVNQTSREKKARRQGHQAFLIESTAEPLDHQADGGMITVSMT